MCLKRSEYLLIYELYCNHKFLTAFFTKHNTSLLNLNLKLTMGFVL